MMLENRVIITGGSCHKYYYNMCLSRQNTSFLPTNIACREKIMFVVTEVLSRQAYFCRDKNDT